VGVYFSGEMAKRSLIATGKETMGAMPLFISEALHARWEPLRVHMKAINRSRYSEGWKLLDDWNPDGSIMHWNEHVLPFMTSFFDDITC